VSAAFLEWRSGYPLRPPEPERSVVLSTKQQLLEGFEELHQFARVLGLHPKTVQRMVARGVFPMLRLGRVNYVHVAGARERLLAQVNDPTRRRRRHAEQAARVAAE
jgi:hypothetical protein